MKKCPFCVGEIQDKAIKCKHCKEYLTDELRLRKQRKEYLTDELRLRKQPISEHNLAVALLLGFVASLIFGVTYYTYYDKGYFSAEDILKMQSIGKQMVTFDEYQRVKNGMSYKQVVAIIGDEGEEISSNKIDGVPGVMQSVETIMYQWVNGDGSNMNAMFQNDKLMQKAQFGLK